VYRRLPSLPYRRFPNLRKVRILPTARLFARPAGWEAKDTAGLETCGTMDGESSLRPEHSLSRNDTRTNSTHPNLAAFNMLADATIPPFRLRLFAFVNCYYPSLN
jgi:hypothetical protein